MRTSRLFAAVLLAGVSVATVNVHDANAGWSKGRSSYSPKISRSYSAPRPSYSSFSSSVNKKTSFSGFGSKPSLTTSAKADTPKAVAPPTSLATNKTDTSYLSKKSSQVASANALNTARSTPAPVTTASAPVKPSVPTTSFSAPARSAPTTVASSGSNYSGGSYYNRRTTIVNHYHYDTPSYYNSYHPMYGMWSGMFMGMVLAHALQPDYYNWAYSHQYDPGYIQWHNDMMQQSASNAQLAAQMAQLNAQVANLNAQHAAPEAQDVLPAGVPEEAAEAPPTQDTTPLPHAVPPSVAQPVPSTGHPVLMVLGGIALTIIIVGGIAAILL